MPFSLASVLIGLGLICAILGFATPAVIAGVVAVLLELGLFIYGGVRDLGA